MSHCGNNYLRASCYVVGGLYNLLPHDCSIVNFGTTLILPFWVRGLTYLLIQCNYFSNIIYMESSLCRKDFRAGSDMMLVPPFV
jgi:hypothetical protein